MAEKLSILELRKMIDESLGEMLKEAETPAARAKRRIIDAYNRGGTSEVVMATKKRVKMTQDPAKLQGIMVAIREIISDNTITFSQTEQRELISLFVDLGAAQLGGTAKPRKQRRV
jgi:hypothetical protein